MHMRPYQAGTLLNRHFIGANDQFWAGWRLVGRINASKHFDLPQSRTFVEPLGIPLLAYLERGVDENLRERDVVCDTGLADAIPLGAEGRNQGADCDDARLRNQAGSLARSPNVFRTAGVRKSQIRTEAMPEIITIQNEAMPTPSIQPIFDSHRQG